MVDAALLSRVKTLSPAERLELIGAVWETLSPADAPVTAEEKVLLDARLADLDNSPEDQSPWSEVQARLRRQYSGLDTTLSQLTSSLSALSEEVVPHAGQVTVLTSST